MVVFLMISARLDALGLLKIKVFWNKSYDVIISIYGDTSKILSRDSSHIIDVAMWPKFGTSSITMKEVIIISILLGFDQKNYFFDWCSWFKFSNLWVAVSIAFKFYAIVTKLLKLKVTKFLGLFSTLVEVKGQKLVGGPFSNPPPQTPSRILSIHSILQ